MKLNQEIALYKKINVKRRYIYIDVEIHYNVLINTTNDWS